MKNIAIYTDVYLSHSMTFIYRQVKGLTTYRPIVLTDELRYSDRFPYDKVYVAETDRSLWSRAVRKFCRIIGGKYVYVPTSKRKYWQKVLQKNHVYLIHAHFGPCGLKMLPLKRELTIPLITTFHGYDVSRLLNDKVYCKNLRVLFKEGTHFLAVSQFMRKKLIALGCPPSKVSTHYIGVPLKDFIFKIRKVNLSDKKIRFLQVSNFVEKKGLHLLISEFAKVNNLFPNTELVLVGDGPMKETIIQEIHHHNLQNQVIMKGQKPWTEIPEELHSAHIFLHRSITAKNGDQDGIPTVIMEAMATGMPVISTEVTGIPELVINGKTGFLVKENDSEGFTAKMIQLLKEPQLWEKFGTEGRKHVENLFDIDKQNQKLEKIYTQVIQEYENINN